MALKDYLFTSESVSEGHPDKVCDQISDVVLDAFLTNDVKLGVVDDSYANSRVVCETLCTTQKIVIAGEVRGQSLLFGCNGVINRAMIVDIVCGVVKRIGYEQDGFSMNGADIEVLLHGQSFDIAMGVNACKGKKGSNIDEQEGVGDQGLMFGFACLDSEVYEKGSYMLAPIYFSYKVLHELKKVRVSGELPDLQFDVKSQVIICYANGRAVGAIKVVVSMQYNEVTAKNRKYISAMVKEMIKFVVLRALPEGWMSKWDIDFLVNPTGNFVVGGFDGDCGLIGRKIIVDIYGGYAPYGGGVFSGKDLIKVDRFVAYAVRYLVKNVVVAGFAERCLIQVVYVIGVVDPMSVYVDTQGIGKVPEEKLVKVLQDIFLLRFTAICRGLQFNRLIYECIVVYGHFGRKFEKDGGFFWDCIDLVPELKCVFAR